MWDRHFVAILAVAVVLSASTTAPSAQQQPSRVPGTFRSAVTLVPLDVRVLDHRGRPVPDLRQEDFVVFENGVPQKIGHFSHQRLTARPEAPDAVLKMRQAPGDALQPQNHRVILLVLGRGRLQYPAKGVDAAIDFVREQLLPQDQVAVLAYNRATDFSTDRGEVIRVLERFRERHEQIEADLKHRISGLAAVYGSRDIPPDMQGRIDGIFGGPETPRFRHLPPGRIVDLESIAADRRDQFDGSDPASSRFDTWVAMNVQTFHDLGNVWQLQASVVAGRDGGKDVLVDLRIDPSRIAFADANGLRTATLNVTVYCGDRRQESVCERWDSAELKFDAEGLERAKKEGVPYVASVPLKDPRVDLRHVKVVVYDYVADILGSASVRVRN